MSNAPLFTKLAKIFGESVDNYVMTGRDIPLSDRMSEYKRYSKLKSKEEPTNPALSTLVGGGIGAAAGALLGRKGHRAHPAALLGLGGGALGLMLALADKHNVQEAKRFAKLSPEQQAKESRRQAIQSLAAREEAEEARRFRNDFRREMHHREMMDELRRR